MMLYTFAMIVILIVLLPSNFHANEKDFSGKVDRVVLNPAELVDMVWEEQMQGKNNPEHDQVPKSAVLNDQDENSPENTVNDEERLKARKVWSRWSKWSKCSVSCGAGALTRRRVCVAGRCAPGEREEQRRACSLAPCHPHAGNADQITTTILTDDLHDDAE